MPTCIVPGCTSGYSSNPEKVHFFTIPRDPTSEKLWKDAVHRANSSVKAGRAVCEKHFLKDEILWQRQLLGPSGQVVGIGQYKIPRLRKGCVPSQFSWTISENVIDKSIDMFPSQFSSLGSLEQTETLTSNIEENIISSSKADLIQDKSIPSNLASEIPMERGHVSPAIQSISVKSASSVSLEFTELLTAEVSLPSGWIKYNTGCGGKKLVFFYTNKTLEIEKTYHMFPFKNVAVEENMSIQLKIVGILLDASKFDMPRYITSIEQLQDLLLKIHRLTVCSGAIQSSVTSGLEASSNALRKDIGDTWRHNQCALLLFNDKICAHCRSAKNTFKKSCRRHARDEVNPQKKKQLSVLLKKYRSALRAKRLAREKIKTLKSKVFEIRRQLARCSNQHLKRHVKDGNIPRSREAQKLERTK
ncbi:uncharacterized protein [Neodiprion pinetum]|uniref:uncharacterized protein n=1 Tax=Neodiprion pinetum TaxID=441929 RepID=UPI00371AF7DC